MSSSRDLINVYFDCLRNFDHSAERCLDLFADDGAFEFPYFAALGMPTRFKGKAELREVLSMIGARFSAFTVSDIDIHEVKGSDALFARYRTDALVKGSQRLYVQDYVSQLIAEDGKIKVLREYLNVINTARALFPNGLADVPSAAD